MIGRENLIERRKSQPVWLAGLQLGGEAPVRIQSMNNTDSRKVEESVEQLKSLHAAGCEISRLAIPDREAAEALREIVKRSPLPLVADIHFDYRLALASMEAGVHKIRINPGNIGGEDRLQAVAKMAKERGIPIRVGVNSGSLDKDLLQKHGGVNAAALAESALRAVRRMEAVGFYDLVVSLKASSPLLTIEAYRLLAKEVPYALHLGVTEAGTLREGTIRSAVGIGSLLAEGIGDTLRVSLTADPVEEVRAAWSILKSLELRAKGPVIISCPTCGRTQVDLVRIAAEVEEKLADRKESIHVAVMGCAVNGPGEAKGADVGIAGGKGQFLLFLRGEVVAKVPEEQAVSRLLDLIEKEFSDAKE